MFRGYKLKFELHAAHTNLDSVDSNRHFHTFSIVLYLKDKDETMDPYNEVEDQINKWLEPYQNVYLMDTKLFKDRSTTIESMGDTFYDEWIEPLLERGLELVKLDIYENPTKVYSVSDKLLDSDINEISAIPYSFTDVISDEEIVEEDVALEVAAAGMDVAATVEENSKVAETIEKEVNRENVLSDKKEEASIADKSYIEFNNKRIKIPVEILKLIVALGVICVTAIAIVMIIRYTGNYPQGSDTFCHIYRGDLLLQHIKNGNWYPLYDGMWYNGVEIMRYWAPIPLYILAGLEYITGSMLSGYLAYIGFIFMIGAIGWLILGTKFHRIGWGAFIGVIWFFLPENINVLIGSGNLPQALVNALIPFFIFYLWKVIDEENNMAVLGISIVTAIMTLCHVGITIMFVATVLIFGLLYAGYNKCIRRILRALVGVVMGLLLAGIWMMPSLVGSGAGNSDGNNQIMANFFSSALVSLNPVNKITGDMGTYYFGLFILIICIIGMFLANKKAKPGFITGTVIFLCTTNSVYYLFAKLPFSNYLWMTRFVPLAMGFIMLALLLWKGLKKSMLVFIIALLLIDVIPEYRYLYNKDIDVVEDVEASLYNRAEGLLLNEAKDITTNRMAIYDLSSGGSFLPYYVAGVDKKTAYSFGAGWEGATTANNIVKLNEAIELGRYAYVFDRSIELGDDTVVFYVSRLKNTESDVNSVITAGKASGYSIVNRNSNILVFHRDMPESPGIITEYENIAIGRAAGDITLLYPDFCEGDSYDLSDYTYEELKDYSRIYLSDFTYEDVDDAEALLSKLADSGVKIYIDMNKLLPNTKNNSQEIYGVVAHTVIFNDNFPEITYKGKTYKTSSFMEENSEWKTVYVTGLKNVTGYGELNGSKLAFSGSADNENIVFLGYNFVYHVEATGDKLGETLLDEILGEKIGSLPDRQIVDIDISYRDDAITIESDYDNVNTTLAYIDIFGDIDSIEVKNNLINVDKGSIELNMNYPYFVRGIMVTIFGSICILLYVLYNISKKRYTREI